MIDVVRAILVELGLPQEELTPHRRLRADLELDSVETTELELELERRFGARIDLWDETDYTLAELAQRVGRSAPGPRPPAASHAQIHQPRERGKA